MSEELKLALGIIAALVALLTWMVKRRKNGHTAEEVTLKLVAYIDKKTSEQVDVALNARGLTEDMVDRIISRLETLPTSDRLETHLQMGHKHGNQLQLHELRLDKLEGKRIR